MKFNPARQTLAVVLIAFVALTMTALTTTRAAEGQNTAPSRWSQHPQMLVDPATGLPLPSPPWKDPDWKDPDRVLAEVVYDGVALREVARLLREEFKNAFDVLIPNVWQDPNLPGESFEPGADSITMQLKNVTASEVFNAMNMAFEAENAPYRWELKLNGKRPTAILRVLPWLLPTVQNPPPPPPPTTRLVYFVGDLIGEEKSGGMTMEQLVKTVSEVYQMSFGQTGGVLQFHKGAQLLIVTGTDDQIQFVQQTLSALRMKARAEHKPEPKPAGPKAKTEETKTF